MSDPATGTSTEVIALSAPEGMLVRELAIALAVPERTVHNAIDRVLPGRKTNGKPTRLSREQVSLVVKELRRSHNSELASTGKVPSTDIEMVEKAAEVVSWAMAKIETQRRAMADLAPRAAVADRIAGAAGLKTLSEVGKINGLGPRKIFELLEARKIIFRGRHGWLPYQEHIDAGRFVVRESTYPDLYEEDHLASQTYVTGKGEVWLAHQFFPAEVP